jgi:hypothetical protein
MRAIVLVPLLLLVTSPVLTTQAWAAGPAPTMVSATVAATNINADLAAADQACAAIADQIQKTDCFNARERTVWLKDSPESIDSFDLFSARRTQLINQYSTGVITWGEYMQGFRAAARHLVVYKTLTASPQ